MQIDDITIEHLGKAKSLRTQPTYPELAQLPWLCV